MSVFAAVLKRDLALAIRQLLRSMIDHSHRAQTVHMRHAIDVAPFGELADPRVLAELGYSDASIAQMAAAGVIGLADMPAQAGH